MHDKVGAAQLLYQQKERCNQAGSSNENLNFEGCVDTPFRARGIPDALCIIVNAKPGSDSRAEKQRAIRMVLFAKSNVVIVCKF